MALVDTMEHTFSNHGNTISIGPSTIYRECLPQKVNNIRNDQINLYRQNERNMITRNKPAHDIDRRASA